MSRVKELVLVTGGAGAIGSNVTAELLRRGYAVHVIDDLSSGYESLLHGDAVFTNGSVTSDRDLDAAFADPPQYVVHLAALFANQNSVEHPAQDLVVNGLGTLKVLERAQRAGVRKLLYASSSCVYGQKELMLEDELDLRPDTPYAISKLTGEQYCRYWSEHYGFDVTIVRLFNSYGPGEFPGRYRNVIPNFFRRALVGQPLVITGTGRETRDFNFVSDTTDGILGALFGVGTSPGPYNVASGVETSILEIAERINVLAANRAGIEFAPRRDWDRVTTRRGAIERAAAAFGYRPKVPIAEGLRRTFEWLSEHDRANPPAESGGSLRRGDSPKSAVPLSG